jgi:hypothetical protein
VTCSSNRTGKNFAHKNLVNRRSQCNEIAVQELNCYVASIAISLCVQSNTLLCEGKIQMEETERIL